MLPAVRLLGAHRGMRALIGVSGDGAMDRMRGPLRLIVRAGFAAALLYVAFRFLQPEVLVAQLNVRLLLGIIVAQPFVIGSFIVFGWRLRLLVGPPLPSARRSFEAFVLGIGLNLVLPARLSELSKPAYLLLTQQVALHRGLGAVVLEKLFDTIVVATMAACLVALATGLGPINRVVPFVLLMAALLAWPAARLAAATLRRFDTPGLLPVADTLELIGRRAPSVQRLRLLALSLIGWTLSFLSLHVCIQTAGSIPLTLDQSLTVFVFTLLGGLIAVLPAGFGTFHAAAVLALRQFGYGMEEAALLSVVLHLQALGFGFLCSLAVLLMNDLRIGQLVGVSGADRGNPR